MTVILIMCVILMCIINININDVLLLLLKKVIMKVMTNIINMVIMK